MEKFFENIAKAWKWLEGKKRRLALLGSAATQVFPAHTVLHKVGLGVFIVFGGADLAENSGKLIKKLPEGLRKKNE